MKYKHCLLFFFVTCATLLTSLSVSSHCQLPCGIYDDHARVKMMLEDANLITKAVKEIQIFANKNDAISQNQLTRWIINKEKHANHIIEVISDYFLTQRIKPSQKDYQERLAKHHAVILAAVTVKQGVDNDVASTLNSAILSLLNYYPDPHHHH